MGAEAQRILEDYRKALDENDWVKQTGILTGLLRMLVDNGSQTEEVARATAEEVLRLQTASA